MKLSLDSNAERLISDRLKSGKYETPEQVVTAALHALEHDEQFGDFSSGELDALIEEGEASEPLDGLTVLDELRKMRAAEKSSGSSRPE